MELRGFRPEMLQAQDISSSWGKNIPAVRKGGTAYQRWRYWRTNNNFGKVGSLTHSVNENCWGKLLQVAIYLAEKKTRVEVRASLHWEKSDKQKLF